MVPVAWSVVLRDYQKQRLVSFIDPAADPLGSGYQLQQSQITVSSGGLFGRGLTNGLAGENLPVGSTDFVFARVAEELGFLGGAVVLALFAHAHLARPAGGLALGGHLHAGLLRAASPACSCSR